MLTWWALWKSVICLSTLLFVCPHCFFVCPHCYLFVHTVICLSTLLFVCPHCYLFVHTVICLSTLLFVCSHCYLFVHTVYFRLPRYKTFCVIYELLLYFNNTFFSEHKLLYTSRLDNIPSHCASGFSNMLYSSLIM